MAMQFSETVLNNVLDNMEASVGASATLTIFDGTMPGTTAGADAGTALVVMALPADWMEAASGGSKAKSGTWQGTAVADGDEAGYYFRIKASGGTVHCQGSVGAVGSGSDIEIDNMDINTGQTITVLTFTWTALGVNPA